MREVARFPTGTVRLGGRLHWNVVRMLEEIRSALDAVTCADPPPDSMGIDTWGVDFGLLVTDGSLLGLPVAYRDPRTEGMMERFFERVPREEIYSRTGIQFIRINTLYQLFAMSQAGSPLLGAAGSFLMIPDLFNYFLTGEKTGEFTNATTTQLFNANDKAWDAKLLEAAGVDPGIMPRVVAPGTVIGELSGEMCERRGMKAIPVIAPATHDTGSAVAAAPAESGGWAYISSGTWSLAGVELENPLTGPEARELNFTNEGGAGGTYRFLKNIMGLWLVQRCREELDPRCDYGRMEIEAANAEPFRSLVFPDDSRFFNPGSMCGEIAGFCRDTGQPAPEKTGQFARCALESLALRYREVLDEVVRAGAERPERLHVLGGGSKNELLCRMTASATGLPVAAGPAEATAAGNIALQAMALGQLDSLAGARRMIRESFDIREYEPGDPGPWDEAYEKYQELRGKI